MSGRTRGSRNRREWLDDALRVALALTLLAVLAAYVQ
jgi:hypothetical protein